jgi:hypothetical protein
VRGRGAAHDGKDWIASLAANAELTKSILGISVRRAPHDELPPHQCPLKRHSEQPIAVGAGWERHGNRARRSTQRAAAPEHSATFQAVSPGHLVDCSPVNTLADGLIPGESYASGDAIFRCKRHLGESQGQGHPPANAPVAGENPPLSATPLAQAGCQIARFGADD